MNMSEKLFVCHFSLLRYYSCRLQAPIKLNASGLLAAGRDGTVGPKLEETALETIRATRGLRGWVAWIGRLTGTVQGGSPRTRKKRAPNVQKHPHLAKGGHDVSDCFAVPRTRFGN
jgi:hypothetical protein